MKWIIAMTLFGFLLVSIAAGVLTADWVTQRFHTDLTATPAVEFKSDGMSCPGQKMVCPAGRKAMDAKLKV